MPVGFAVGPLYHGSLVNYGLLIAAVLAAVLIVLIVVGSDGKELRGAGLAAALAAFVLLAPLVVALLGQDYYIVRALIRPGSRSRWWSARRAPPRARGRSARCCSRS